MASVPINNAGALLADIWDGDRRGKAMSIFALAPFAGPSLGPIVSGYIQVSGTVSPVYTLLCPECSSELDGREGTDT